jgi:hypothetical protein
MEVTTPNRGMAPLLVELCYKLFTSAISLSAGSTRRTLFLETYTDNNGQTGDTKPLQTSAAARSACLSSSSAARSLLYFPSSLSNISASLLLSRPPIHPTSSYFLLFRPSVHPTSP